MCMFCAAIPVAGAIGAKINADQNRIDPQEPSTAFTESQTRAKRPVAAMTGGVIVLLLIGSVVYHTTMFANN